MRQICETCLKLQKSYSEALRIYADALQAHTERITTGDYSQAIESNHSIAKAQELCAQHRITLQRHEAEAHGKTLATHG